MPSISRGVKTVASFLFLAVAAVVMVAMAVASAGAQPAISEWSVPTVASQPANIAADSFGNMWFTETAGNKIGRGNQNGVIQEFDIPTPGSQPWGIAVDTSNRIWFTEVAGNKIGNVTPYGIFGQDNIPTADSQPRGLAIDPSGNVWFAESRGNKIGKMTPSGSFTEWDVPTDNSQPWGVALDSSGNVWFTERTGGKIGRMTPDGQFVEYGMPAPGRGPAGIAVDASSNVWIAEYDANMIAMMTPSGAFIEYEIPIANSRPTWVALDRSGGVWYAGSGSNSFGRIAGGMLGDPYGLPTANSTPYGVAVDVSGNVWLTEQSANKIAKATALAPVATPTPVTTPMPTPGPTARDARYFSQTGFRIDNDVFWDYFNKRGGVRTFGYPVSRTFTFLGFTTQFFQREIMQIAPDGTARTMNLLDPGLMPYTRINGSNFPAADSSLASAAPPPGSSDYGFRVQEFIVRYAPNQYEGLNVNFYQAFQSTVTLADAFPQGGGNPGLLPLLNLELWGMPTSRPTYDPNNRNFVYLRWQRGIMHFDASNGYTQGLLLADYLKSIMTGANLPGDLDEQARSSDLYRQYNPSRSNWVDRPDKLPNTNLFYAFEKQ